MNKKLVVIARHHPSVLLAKGEYVPRYYNPGNVFDEIHLLLTNDDQFDTRKLQFAAGSAKLYVHNLPRPDFVRTMGWNPLLTRDWIERGVSIGKKIGPNLLRVHNNFLEGYLAMRLKRRLNIPYVVSIHHSEHQFRNTLQRKALGYLQAGYEKGSLREADGIIAVYQSNLEYAQELGGNDARLIYNVVSNQIPVKENYSLPKPPRLITINQQKRRKFPGNILRAVKHIDCEYWVVGNGPAHQELLDLAKDLKLEDKVRFSTGIPNNELTTMLNEFDLHVSHCDVWGMSKTVIEASLAALPTLINYHPIRPIPEYSPEWISRCENSPEGYRKAIVALLEDENTRRDLGKKARQRALDSFDPDKMEQRLELLYREKMSSN